jgi:hypothetical protein
MMSKNHISLMAFSGQPIIRTVVFYLSCFCQSPTSVRGRSFGCVVLRVLLVLVAPAISFGYAFS